LQTCTFYKFTFEVIPSILKHVTREREITVEYEQHNTHTFDIIHTLLYYFEEEEEEEEEEEQQQQQQEIRTGNVLGPSCRKIFGFLLRSLDDARHEVFK